MITSLTPYQQSQIQIYLDNALTVGLSTNRLNRQETINAVNCIHELIKAPNKPIIQFYDSPLQCQLARQEAVKENPNNSQLDSQLNSQLRSQLDSQLYSQLRSQLYSQLSSQLYSQLYSQLSSQLYSQLRSQLPTVFNSNYWSPNYWSGYYNFYYYIRNELFSERRQEFPLLDTVIEWIKQLHYVENLGHYYFVSERPTNIVMENGKLHCTKGPSIEYADGFSIYSINGEMATEEQKKTIIHNIKFNKVIEDILEGELE